MSNFEIFSVVVMVVAVPIVWDIYTGTGTIARVFQSLGIDQKEYGQAPWLH